MIYTCTSNPSLDYYLCLEDDLQQGKINRTVDEHYDAGGKGVNVSIVLNGLHIPNTALGFLGGFSRGYFLSCLTPYTYLQPQFTRIQEATRINIKLNEHGQETSVNARGPHISEEEFARFRLILQKVYPGDYFVLSGNVQEEIREQLHEVLKELVEEDTRLIIDTDAPFAKMCLDLHPYLLRLSLEEAEEVSGKSGDEGLKRLAEKARNVICRKDNGWLMYHDEEVYEGILHQNDSGSTTGRNDTCVAGFLFGLLRGASPEEAFRYGVAAAQIVSDADVLTADLSGIEESYHTAEVRRL
ncbi:MAG: hypothetical protein IKE21_06720 [Erysipelotrichaceae bacterium]|nr:hypothetical protein [Erysipelotrichaceae bacterium]